MQRLQIRTYVVILLATTLSCFVSACEVDTDVDSSDVFMDTHYDDSGEDIADSTIEDGEDIADSTIEDGEDIADSTIEIGEDVDGAGDVAETDSTGDGEDVGPTPCNGHCDCSHTEFCANTGTCQPIFGPDIYYCCTEYPDACPAGARCHVPGTVGDTGTCGED